MNPTALCPVCGQQADYVTLGHMFELNCSHCGHGEAGTFNPAVPSVTPIPIAVLVNTSGVALTAESLFAFSKLHPTLGHMSPAELKAAFVAANDIVLPCHNMQVAETLIIQASSAGFNACLNADC